VHCSKDIQRKGSAGTRIWFTDSGTGVVYKKVARDRSKKEGNWAWRQKEFLGPLPFLLSLKIRVFGSLLITFGATLEERIRLSSEGKIEIRSCGQPHDPMRYRREGPDIIARMFSDEDYIENLLEICRTEKIGTAVIISSIGQLKDVSLGYFVEKGNYEPEEFEGPFELLSVSGIISGFGDGYIPHLHAVLGDREKRSIGGHLLKGRVNVTSETVLRILDVEVLREHNEDTDLMDLEL
jgi:predicted DNA-binding protein with PD1-like motif